MRYSELIKFRDNLKKQVLKIEILLSIFGEYEEGDIPGKDEYIENIMKDLKELLIRKA